MWCGVFLDVLDQEIIDKIIDIVMIQKPIQEVSHCASLMFNLDRFNALFYTGEGVYAPSKHYRWTS